MGRTHRLLGLAALIAAATAASGTSAEPAGDPAFGIFRLSAPIADACAVHLEHLALAGRDIEGRTAGARGLLAYRIRTGRPVADASAGRSPVRAFPVAASGTPAPGITASRASGTASPVSGSHPDPSRAAPASSPTAGFAAPPVLAISDAEVYPNPFNPATRNTVIGFVLSKDAEVEITAYDWAGAFVDRVFRGSRTAGPNTVEWGGQTEDGRKLGNGVYLIRIVASTEARKESQVLKAVVWNEG